jgi:hypothetical protein
MATLVRVRRRTAASDVAPNSIEADLRHVPPATASDSAMHRTTIDSEGDVLLPRRAMVRLLLAVANRCMCRRRHSVLTATRRPAEPLRSSFPLRMSCYFYAEIHRDTLFIAVKGCVVWIDGRRLSRLPLPARSGVMAMHDGSARVPRRTSPDCSLQACDRFSGWVPLCRGAPFRRRGQTGRYESAGGAGADLAALKRLGRGRLIPSQALALPDVDGLKSLSVTRSREAR